MEHRSFWKLHNLIQPYMPVLCVPEKAQNGPITSEMRLAMALRYFSGGDPLDIAPLFGVGHSEVSPSVWAVVDAVNQCPELKYEYPSDHEKQKEIASGFYEKSSAFFDCCAGAIDCMLIWISKPQQWECDALKVHVSEFFCKRKDKYGLSLQGIVDSDCRFLDICVAHPAKAGDCTVYMTSEIGSKVESETFIAPGLCLFGDQAYVDSLHMAVPKKGQVDDYEDAYNFYHSQLRIRVEMAFGILVSRFGILRKCMPINITIERTMAMVQCLVRLHNYCINQQLSTCESLQINKRTGIISKAQCSVDEATAGDALALSFDAVPLVSNHFISGRPSGLLDGGHHYDDVPTTLRREWNNRLATSREMVEPPCDKMRREIKEMVATGVLPTRPLHNLERNRRRKDHPMNKKRREANKRRRRRR